MKKLIRPIYGMANLTRSDIDEQFEVWIDEAGKNRKVPHGARIKAEANNVEISIKLLTDGTIDFVNPKGKFNDKIKKFQYGNDALAFAERFQAPIMMHYNKEISTTDLLLIIRLVIKRGKSVEEAIQEVIS